jgi:hypothetical protein
VALLSSLVALLGSLLAFLTSLEAFKVFFRHCYLAKWLCCVYFLY